MSNSCVRQARMPWSKWSLGPAPLPMKEELVINVPASLPLWEDRAALKCLVSILSQNPPEEWSPAAYSEKRSQMHPYWLLSLPNLILHPCQVLLGITSQNKLLPQNSSHMETQPKTTMRSFVL